MTNRRLSKAGAGAGAAHEACYLFAYPDPGTGGDPWTIGVGHTGRAGLPNVRRGDRISFTRAFEIYAVDMGKVETDVNRAITVDLEQHEFDAACIFHLNTGAIRAGSVDDKLNRGDRAGAFKTWGAYINAGGKPMKGLITRRAEEIEIFKTGRYPTRRILVKDTQTGSGRYVAPSSIPWRGDVPAGGIDPTPVARPAIVAEIPAPKIVTSPVKVATPARPIGKPASAPWYSRFWEWISTGNDGAIAGLG